MHIFSFSPFGYEGSLVSVEVDLRRGIPAIDLVGLADGAVKESRERMRSAIRNSGLEFPSERVLISLSPADLKKEGAGFDLAIALAVLDAKLHLDKKDDEEEKIEINEMLVMGELDLAGNVKAVRGIQAAVSTAFDAGISYCIVPEANREEAKQIKGMKIFACGNLLDALNAMITGKKFEIATANSKTQELKNGFEEINGIIFPPVDEENNIENVVGQKELIRGLEIAAAGGHNVIAFGAPGCGKTLALQRFPCLLPTLTEEESLKVTRIYSIAGLLAPDKSLIQIAPFRAPHQTASIEGMCGGGPRCTPGEISLAQNGVLFLDEASQFKSSVLQMLRVPLECGSITLSRAGRSTVYPAQFQLLIATNPCPCGNFGSKEKLCLCSAHSIEQYWKKFSAPLLDRIDIRVHVDHPSITENPDYKADLHELRKKIATATYIQRERQGKKNARLTAQEISKYCIAEKSAKELLAEAVEKYGMSPRSTSSCLKLARTIADMEAIQKIGLVQMEEAIKYRKTALGLGNSIQNLM
ncbi:MAG: YifB family Mg chelatase-like AAA ATPase [Treponema sp.]|nr:YifB family Mg chelatase-like AAA ATPase [Treponema sp.]